MFNYTEKELKKIKLDIRTEMRELKLKIVELRNKFRDTKKKENELKNYKLARQRLSRLVKKCGFKLNHDKTGVFKINVSKNMINKKYKGVDPLYFVPTSYMNPTLAIENIRNYILPMISKVV